MVSTVVSAVGFLAAAAAAVLPYLPKPAPADGVSPGDRAGWVNRLFVLAAQADSTGEPAIAAAARSLIAALVAEKELPRKGR
jgi:hypothetical protein